MLTLDVSEQVVYTALHAGGLFLPVFLRRRPFVMDGLQVGDRCLQPGCIRIFHLQPRRLFLHRALSGDYCKIYGLIYANSETGWGTGELQSTAERRYHLARPFKATLAVRDDGQRLG